MIHMPRRNVTRFFIPLIDVLILLFCIFLLMEFNTATKADAAAATAPDSAIASPSRRRQGGGTVRMMSASRRGLLSLLSIGTTAL